MNGRSRSAGEIAALRRLGVAGWTEVRIGEELGRARETLQRKRASRRLKGRRMGSSLP
ncbi:hypothetical protein [Reyranella sp.]|uniref:hypothetical protein n=1 Tax=Reyranella sp. TaxID=1929291 RepID=UPI003D096E25